MQTISPQELQKRIDKGEKLYVLDVREDWEYEEANMGGHLIPLGSLPQRLEEVKAGKDEEIIVHCRSGKRSATAQKYLQQQGYTKVYNLEGGIEAWKQL